VNLLKSLTAIILFYFLAIIQNSFFVHFNFWGIFPNFILIFFVLLVFFSDKSGEIIFYAVTAGLFLDIFHETYFGISIIILIAIGFFVKKIQLLLQETEDKYPLGHYLFLFLFSFIAYQITLILYLRFIDPIHLRMEIGLKHLFDALYNIFFASASFYIFRKFANISNDNKQLKMFK